MKQIDAVSALELLKKNFSKNTNYLAMYSSLYGGVVRDPALMMIPIDEHLVHRGDGVFEAMRCIEGGIYDMHSHLNRLENSAEGIGLRLPNTKEEIASIIADTIRISESKNGTVRLYVSRGPGDFSPNPYTTIGSQLYIVYTAPNPYPQELYEKGAKLGLSKLKAKDAPFCGIKSCNYLVNVLMKKEAIDKDLNFMIASTEEGFLTESATENVAIVSKNKTLYAPMFDRMLKGTTLCRVLELCRANPEAFGLKAVEQKNINVDDFLNANGALIIGTTMGVMPVASFENKRYPDVQKNNWYKLIREAFISDTLENSEFRSEVF